MRPRKTMLGEVERVWSRIRFMATMHRAAGDGSLARVDSKMRGRVKVLEPGQV